MIFMLVIIGLITAIAGLTPLVGKYMPFIPDVLLTTPVYAGVVVVIGLVGLAHGFMSMSLMGLSKFLAIMLGFLTIVGGVLPLLSNLLKETLPAVLFTAPAYGGIILVIGLGTLVYGWAQY